jgi:hypothetical protein
MVKYTAWTVLLNYFRYVLIVNNQQRNMLKPWVKFGTRSTLNALNVSQYWIPMQKWKARHIVNHATKE